MDRYGVQNGNWRKQEVEVKTIKRIIYTSNKQFKKEYKGGKLANISTTSKNQPEKRKIEETNSKEATTHQKPDIECVLFNKKHRPFQTVKEHTSTKQNETPNKNPQPTILKEKETPTKAKNECTKCKALYHQLQEEKFQRILAENQAEFWEGLQKDTETQRKRLEGITKKIKRQANPK